MTWLEEHLLIVWFILTLNAFIYGVRKLATDKCTCFSPSNGDLNRKQCRVLANAQGEHVVFMSFILEMEDLRRFSKTASEVQILLTLPSIKQQNNNSTAEHQKQTAALLPAPLGVVDLFLQGDRLAEEAVYVFEVHAAVGHALHGTTEPEG